MTEDLQPCPFCGGQAQLYVDDGVRVICSKCKCQTMILKDIQNGGGVVGNAINSVIEKWNKRA